jgi:hypothetical protein
LPAASANQPQSAGAILVPELRQPAALRRPEIAASEAPMGRTTVVPELSGRAPPRAPMVLPAPFAEAPRSAAASRPLTPLATRTPVEPNPAVTVVPRPAVPPAAALAGVELERLADKVSRIIARRVAVERERRGR